MQRTSGTARTARRHYRMVFILGGVLLASLAGAGAAAETKPTSIAVFDFELDDHSAGSGIVAADAHDALYLAQATDEARRRLAASGRFTLVDTRGAEMGAAKTLGLRNCGGCAAEIAKGLGAEQALIGVVTRVNRTEYTLLIRITDADTGAVISNNYTNLRMGANYAWPRGVKWLMDNQLLPAAGK